jgi:hypothetical protein
MTASERNKSPDFFEDYSLDPVMAATRRQPARKSVTKKKAGFYLSEPLLKRFNRLFHQMKLAGLPIENKSALLETALAFAMDDLEKGEHSQLLQTYKRL